MSAVYWQGQDLEQLKLRLDEANPREIELEAKIVEMSTDPSTAIH